MCAIVPLKFLKWIKTEKDCPVIVTQSGNSPSLLSNQNELCVSLSPLGINAVACFQGTIMFLIDNRSCPASRLPWTAITLLPASTAQQVYQACQLGYPGKLSCSHSLSFVFPCLILLIIARECTECIMHMIYFKTQHVLIVHKRTINFSPLVLRCLLFKF